MKEISKSFIFILLTLSIPIALNVGCAQKKLTNEKAKSIIIEHFKYPQPVYQGMMAGKTAYSYWKNKERQKQKINDLLEPLAKEGLITYISHPGGDIDVFVTEKGRQYVDGEIRDDRYATASIKIAEKQFLEVVSILPEDGTKAQVEYTWRFGNITPFGKHMKSKKWKSTEPKKEKIQICLHDDGWRVCD
jgi:hypothetical protein